MLKVERSYNLNAIGKEEVTMPTELDERNVIQELQRGNVEVEEWERVVSLPNLGLS